MCYGDGTVVALLQLNLTIAEQFYRFVLFASGTTPSSKYTTQQSLLLRYDTVGGSDPNSKNFYQLLKFFS